MDHIGLKFKLRIEERLGRKCWENGAFEYFDCTGLYDMLGNVWEWCHDGLRAYTADAAVDPMGPTEADAHRVLRGGSWGHSAQIVRAAYRGYDDPGNRYADLGFRCSSAGPSE